MKDLSLFDLISEDKKIKKANNYYYHELSKILEINDDSKILLKYYEGLSLAQRQICELNSYIYYIKSFNKISNDRKKQLQNYNKIIREKKKLYNQIVEQIKRVLLNNNKLYTKFLEIINYGNEIQKYYIYIASHKELIINILYNKFKNN